MLAVEMPPTVAPQTRPAQPGSGWQMPFTLSPDIVASNKQSAKQRVNQIHTKVAFRAACQGLECKSAYELEHKYLLSLPPGDVLRNRLPFDRSRVFNRWSKGHSSISGHYRRENKQVFARIDFIVQKYPAFYGIIHSPIWTYLDPQPVDVGEVGRDPYERRLRQDGVLPAKTDSAHVTTLQDLQMLVSYAKTHQDMLAALTVLWKWMRCCVLEEHIPEYTLLYNAWRKLYREVAEDPLLSPVAQELYVHSDLSFTSIRYK